MRKTSWMWIVLLLLLTLPFVAGCGDDDDPSTDGDQTTDGDQSTDGDATDGDATDGDTTDGDVADGDTTDGDVTDGDMADGDVADGDAVDGDAETVTLAGTFDWGTETENFEPTELAVMDMLFQTQAAINEVASDDDLWTQLDNEVTRTKDAFKSGMQSCRTIDPAAGQPYIIANYDACTHANGSVHLSIEGSVGERYYLADFQDDFEIFGVDIDGQIELERTDAVQRRFALRVLNGTGRRLTVGLDRDNKHHRLLLLLAATLLIQNDTVEVTIPRNDQVSHITGDAGWTDADVQLGARKLGLFTSDQTAGALVFPRDITDCLCPSNGPLGVAAAFEDLGLQLKDRQGTLSDALDDALSGRPYATAVAERFQNFVYSFTQDLEGDLGYQFTAVCGDVSLDLSGLPVVKIPVQAGNTECPLPGDQNVMARVATLLQGVQSLTDAQRSMLMLSIRNFLLEQADEDGCLTLDATQLQEAVRTKIAESFDWELCGVQ